MKSFQNFINLTERTVGSAGRPSQSLDPQEQDIEDFKRETGKRKTRSSVEAARERLASTPVLTDDEMRAQNPSATAAYEKDVKERRSRSVTVDTPEGQITSGGASRSGKIPIQTSSGKTIYVTPDEAIARAEAGLKPPVKNKPKKIVSTTTPTPTAPKPTPTPTAPKPVAPSSVSLSLTRSSAPKVSAGPTLSVSTPKPEPITAGNLGKVVTDVMKTEREAKAAEKAAKAVKTAKTLSGAAKVAGLLGAGIEAKGAYDIARSKGAGFKTSVGAAAARGLGALGGAAVGGALGSVLGPVGSVAGGVAGYTAGSQLASKAYDVLRGDVTKPITSQSVLRNIRRAVPQEVRSQVPAGARKAFRDLVTSTGRSYGNWSRSQEAKK